MLNVRITRTPGLFVLPPLAQTITDRAIAGGLASDIESLPVFPSGIVSCPVDFGTSYTLAFSTAGGGAWSAVISVLGCRRVKLSDGRVLSALNASKLFADLGGALDLAPDELIPRPCDGATVGTRCYPQPSLPSG